MNEIMWIRLTFSANPEADTWSVAAPCLHECLTSHLKHKKAPSSPPVRFEPATMGLCSGNIVGRLFPNNPLDPDTIYWHQKGKSDPSTKGIPGLRGCNT